ncbi:MAG: sigma-70 family RNA polymerase sigma factor [Patescibacteria group bacterium]|nr:sigma-70 family RNA polymerase sigma factor [Patescibacteria group bacterium]
MASKKTVSGQSPLQQYLTRMTGPRLDFGTERALIAAAKTGDVRAQDRLNRSQILFIYRIAMRFSHDPETIMDLCQEGCLAIAWAVGKFDLSRAKGRLSTFASWHIRNYMRAYMRDNVRPMRLPANLSTDVARRTALEEGRTRTENGEVRKTDDDLTAEERAGLQALRLLLVMPSLDEKIGGVNGEGGQTYKNLVPDQGEGPEAPLALTQEQELVHAAYWRLSAQDRLLLRLLVIENMTLEAVGKRAATLGLSKKNIGRERVRQKKVDALARLQTLLAAAGYEP